MCAGTQGMSSQPGMAHSQDDTGQTRPEKRTLNQMNGPGLAPQIHLIELVVPAFVAWMAEWLRCWICKPETAS